jgi:small subunit ribosomal protein S1
MAEDKAGGTVSLGSSFAALFEAESAGAGKRRRNLRVGERVSAVVVQVGKDSVFFEVDGKQQAFMNAEELRDEHGELSLKEGDTVTAQVVEVDARAGIVRLGRSAGRPGNLAGLQQAREGGLAVEGKVTGLNKGGLDVDLGGIRAFCPISQADSRYVEDANVFVGQTLRFLVTDIRDGGRNVVVSRKALLQKEASDSATVALVDIVPGAVLKGIVTSVRDFGAFVDLGGIEGLIPRSEVAHDRSVQVGDALKAGDAVEVAVREVKPGAGEGAKSGGGPRVTLSLKALMADPWADLDLVEGRVMRGEVMRVAEFGAFVRIAPAVEGLLHVSELGRGGSLATGSTVDVVVKKADRASKKISLTLAPEGLAPGAQVPSLEVKVGAVVSGTVERIETYGIFVQLEGSKGRAGRGLVPNAELGVPRGTDLRKAFPEGTKVQAKVLETGEGRLRLSLKGAKDAEERADYEQAKSQSRAPTSLGTFADLFQKAKAKKK